jgi:Ca2+-binding EF-hand superfamily protein
MRSKEKLTNIDKRKLTYDRPITHAPIRKGHPLDLPLYLENKISPNEHRKLKEAFFIEASMDLKLSREKFPVVMRSMGIIEKTAEFHEIFSELEEKLMTW